MASIKSQVGFKPLHPIIAAECYGVDFSKPVPPEVVTEIVQGLAKYGVLVFRKAQLDDARHVAFASQLGELDDSTPYIKAGRKHRLAPYTELFDVSNLDDDGNLVSTDSLRYQLGLGNGLFHVDSAFNPRRAGYSVLRAHQLPPKGTGGATAFADTRTAYADLDGDTKERIQDYVVNHSLWHSRRLAAPDCEFLKGMIPEQHFMGRHKLAQLHEPSGRMNLYIAHHAHHIESLGKEEGQQIIRDLLKHATQDKYTVEVDWENNGDIIIWDNTCVMHKVCRGSFEGKYVRDMRRATVHDASSTAWGLNERTDFRAGMP
ncbi:Clavaminate synthase-like protein [Trematosphaeria pertusa]|uniref:Clavaminate synthase-like protein n=1 Tax=Trematosphaeria pertusa TaxID=390896 RepID=A0A6A6I5Z6_9PLEO|nr:Clavaminate synthase-like protein [Trematosphaeria pertusa]KAF2245955.1 Clavaminate synthase-like protein [Trematosphaeria pertusa]